MLIGVSGKKRHGKDTIAGCLTRQHGFVRLGFADVLRFEIISRLGGTIRAHLAAPKYLADQYSDADLLTYLQGKPDDFSRLLQQEYGTQVRRQDNPDYWVNRWQAVACEHPAPHLVVPDVRFPNEALKILDTDGLLLRVVRPDLPDDDPHESEHALDGFTAWDAVIINDGTVADLEAKVSTWMDTVRHDLHVANQAV